MLENQTPTGRRILVVDDDVDIRSNLTDILIMLGYQTDSACDGRSALYLASLGHYDVAVVDYQMPGMNGAELARQLKQIHPDLIAIMVTAYAGADGPEEALRAGACRVLPKPVDFEELLPLVQYSA